MYGQDLIQKVLGDKKATKTVGPIKPGSPNIKTAYIPEWLGGGVYLVDKNNPQNVVRSERDYAGVKAEAGKNRDHLIPVSLGGVSDDQRNIRVVPKDQNPAKLETEIAAKQKNGLPLGQARLTVLTEKQKRDGILNPPQGVVRNFLGGLKDTLLSQKTLDTSKITNFIKDKTLLGKSDKEITQHAPQNIVIKKPLLQSLGDLGKLAGNKILQNVKKAANEFPALGDNSKEAQKKRLNLVLMFGGGEPENVGSKISKYVPEELPGNVTKPANVVEIRNVEKPPVESVGGLKDLKNTSAVLDEIKGKSNDLVIAPKEQGTIPPTQKEIQVFRKEANPSMSQKIEPRPLNSQVDNLKIGQNSPQSSADIVSKDVSYNNVIPDNGSVVKPPTVRGDITPPTLDFTKFKDKSVPRLTRDTFERNIEKVAGDQGTKVKKFALDPLRDNETNRVKFTNDLRKEIKKTVISDLKIKPGSKEDILTQRLGEKRITLTELKKETPNWQQVQEAATYFRNKYDELLDLVNGQRTKHGYDPIPKRADYFRHFQEVGNVIDRLGVLFKENDLPTEISGITNIFKPGKPFSTAEMQRKGGQFTESAIKGMDNYIDAVSKQAFHIDSVQRIRALEKYIREAGGAGKANLPNFVANLTELGNQIAGKKALFDRAVESTIGRTAYGVLNAMKKRVGANMIGANISSALTNFIPFTQLASTTSKPSLIKGFIETVSPDIIRNPTIIDGVESSFLTRRFPDDKIALTGVEKASELANSIFKMIDKFTARATVASKYYENLKKGMDSGLAMKRADSYAGKVLADRSLGNQPNLFGSKTLGVATQFQLEVNNILSFVKRDMPTMAEGNKLKYANYLAQFFVYSYLFNEGYKKLTGRRPTIDPIFNALQIMGKTDDTEGRPLKERVGLAGKDLAGQLPFVNIVLGGGRIPLAGSLPNISGLLKGTAKPGKEALKTGAAFALPFGGNQLKKTYQGISTYIKGGEKDSKGKYKYKVTPTKTNMVKGALFGPSSFQETQDYYNGLGVSKKKKAKAQTPTLNIPSGGTGYGNDLLNRTLKR